MLYDIATQLSGDGLDQEHTQLMHTTRGTLNIYSRYFMLWANYSTLCLGLLTDPSLAKELEGEVFSSGIPLRQYCLSRASETWQLLSQNMNITAEERVHLVNQTIEYYYMVTHTITLLLHVDWCYRKAKPTLSVSEEFTILKVKPMSMRHSSMNNASFQHGKQFSEK